MIVHMLINGYQIQEEIGRGDAAIVYRAVAPNGQIVALKISLDDNPDRFGQMKQEAQVLSWLKQEGVPRCYNTFEFEGRQCVVLEWVSGINFDSILEERSIPFAETQAILWGIRLASILNCLHTHPIPHIYRSLAPEHILLTESGQLYLIDYGKADSYKPGTTFPAIGLVGYSPPEQYVGLPEPQSDVFSLGVFLYHITTLRDPRKPNAAFLFYVMPPRAINPGLSPEFERVILRAVEHKALDRFATMAAMREALLACAA
jgi:serine/threonine protein kinase